MWVKFALVTCAFAWMSLIGALHARADVAAPNPSSPIAFHLYYIAATGDLVRAECLTTTSIHNRANCTANPQLISVPMFMDELLGTYGNQAETFETRVAEDYAKIQDIDRKILELIDVSPNPAQGEQIRQQIQVAAGVVSTKLLFAEQLKDQLARVKEGLDQSPSDINLQQQFIKLTADLAVANRDLETARAELARLNQEYNTVNSGLLTEDQFLTLSRQREALVADANAYQTQYEIQLDWRKEATRSLNMIQDHTFVYETAPAPGFGPDLHYVVQGFGGCFDRVVQRMKNRTFERNASDPMLFELNQPYDLEVEEVTCSFDIWQTECTESKVLLTSGLGYSASFDGGGFMLFNSGIPGYPSPEVPNYVGKSGKGKWSARLSCVEGVPAHILSMGAICTLRMK